MNPREEAGAVVRRRGLGLSWDSEEGMGKRGEGGMGLGPDGLRRRDEARRVLGVWLVTGVGGTIQKCATWGRSGFEEEISSAWD